MTFKLNLSIFIPLIVLALAACAGCAALADKQTTGTVIARRSQIRSSTATVAADLLAVVRGDTLDILETETVENGNQKETWYRVRAHDAANTEGWIEARDVIRNDLLERSFELARKDKDIPTQSTGQLRASSNLRYTPDRSRADNILLRLDNGTRFDIIGMKRVPPPKNAETNVNESGAPSDELNELWYEVRLDKSVSPAPAGWLFGRQVELTVPAEIIFYRTGREFVAWHRLGTSASADAANAEPSSWVILEKGSEDDEDYDEKLIGSDFDRIYVLGYDKNRQEHYTVYRSPDLYGRLPLRVEGEGNNQSFVVQAQDGNQLKELRYRVSTDDKGRLRVEAPPMPNAKGKKAR
jgi:hypothetical protein